MKGQISNYITEKSVTSESMYR